MAETILIDGKFLLKNRIVGWSEGYRSRGCDRWVEIYLDSGQTIKVMEDRVPDSDYPEWDSRYTEKVVDLAITLNEIFGVNAEWKEQVE